MYEGNRDVSSESDIDFRNTGFTSYGNKAHLVSSSPLSNSKDSEYTHSIRRSRAKERSKPVLVSDSSRTNGKNQEYSVRSSGSEQKKRCRNSSSSSTYRTRRPNQSYSNESTYAKCKAYKRRKSSNRNSIREECSKGRSKEVLAHNVSSSSTEITNSCCSSSKNDSKRNLCKKKDRKVVEQKTCKAYVICGSRIRRRSGSYCEEHLVHKSFVEQVNYFNSKLVISTPLNSSKEKPKTDLGKMKQLVNPAVLKNCGMASTKPKESVPCSVRPSKVSKPHWFTSLTELEHKQMFQSTNKHCTFLSTDEEELRRKLSNLQKHFYSDTSAVSGDKGNVLISLESDSRLKVPKILRKLKTGNAATCSYQVARFSDGTIAQFEKMNVIGQGAYGTVYECRDKETGDKVAIKKINYVNAKDNIGFCMSNIREINVLKQVNHKNIINLKTIITSKHDASIGVKGNFIYLVLEYMDHDLEELIFKKKVHFSSGLNASIMKQMLEGVAYCHQKGILHRDIKPGNVLINERCEVKLADFGISRMQRFENKRPYTTQVATMGYRSPELILGDVWYGHGVDIWSCGCILGELFTGVRLFECESELELLEDIYQLCGTPSLNDWPSAFTLPLYYTMRPLEVLERRILQDYCTSVPKRALDLFDKMLELNPNRRITAKDALAFSWFKKIEFDRMHNKQLAHFKC